MGVEQSKHETLLCQPDEQGHQYWTQFEQQPFDQGASRVAFKGILTGNGPRDGQQCVTKAFKEGYSKNMVDWMPDLAASKKSKKFADKFTEKFLPSSDWQVRFLIPLLARVDKVGGQYFLGRFNMDPADTYVNKQTLVAIEPFLPGTYMKFNSNGGYENPYVGDLLRTFSHWTWHVSGHRFMICDLQGIRLSNLNYVLTDPAVHSAEQMYGKTDLGVVGMEMVLAKHRCNAICNNLGLPNPLTGQRLEFWGNRSTTYSFQLTEEQKLRNLKMESKFFQLEANQLDRI